MKAMVKGLNAIYPSFNHKSRNRQRIENAFYDSMFFYKLTNHLNPNLVKLAWRKDRKEGFREKRLGLIHPREVPPGFDFLNAAHAPWCHPCDETEITTASFIDLYEEALRECIAMLADLNAVLAGQGPLAEVAARVGNASLDTGRENCTPVHSRPLPLRKIIDDIYRKLEAEMEAGQGGA
jgi:hypothetical protein